MNRENIDNVKQYYDENAQLEWDRLGGKAPFEFELTTYVMDQYIRPGDSVLDIGGGPGRYSIYYAQKGCVVTLAELSEGNVAVAKEKAAEVGASFAAHAVNCLELDALNLGQFDHVFLMGPLYHLREQADQIEAVNIALRHLKPGGKLYVSFIQVFAGLIYDLQHGGYLCGDMVNPDARRLVDNMFAGKDYIGPGFTEVCFHHLRNIEPFMARFSLKKLRLFSQESFLAPNKHQLLERSAEELALWVELGKRYIDLPEILPWAEHIMYIGEKE